jgi:hypothetical protein
VSSVHPSKRLQWGDPAFNWLLIGGFVMVLAMAWHQAWAWYQAGSWTSIDARVFHVQRSSLTGGSKAYDTVHVAYHFDGRRRVHTYERSHADAKVGQVVAVLIDPRDPARALRRRGDAFDLARIGIAALVYVVFMWMVATFIESRR